MSAVLILQIAVTMLFSSVAATIIKIGLEAYRNRKILLVGGIRGTVTETRWEKGKPNTIWASGEKQNGVFRFDLEIENGGTKVIKQKRVGFYFDDQAKVSEHTIILPSRGHKFELDAQQSEDYTRKFEINFLNRKEVISLTFLSTGNKENSVEICALEPEVKLKSKEAEVKRKRKALTTIMVLLGFLSLSATVGTWLFGAKVQKQAEISDRAVRTLKSLVSVMVKSAEGATRRGTGFFVNEKGDIITAYHVIEGAREIFVQPWQDSTKFRAVLVASGRKQDLALLRVTAPDFSLKYSSATFADSTLKLSHAKQLEMLTINAETKQPVYLSGQITRLSEDTIEMSTGGFLYPGTSASPVLLRDFALVVGIVQYARVVARISLDDSTETLCGSPLGLIPAERIKDFLRENSVPYTEKRIKASDLLP
jgi:hypothetical protein